MKAKTLLEELQKAIAVHGEDLHIVVETDHGQEVMSATFAGVSEVEDTDEYMMEIIDHEEYGDDGCLFGEEPPIGVKVFHIQGY